MTDTDFEDEEFETIVVQRSENDLIYCHVEDNISTGHEGIVNLDEIIEALRNLCTEKGRDINS